MTHEVPPEVRWKAKQIWHNFRHLKDDPAAPPEMGVMLDACRKIAGIPEEESEG